MAETRRMSMKGAATLNLILGVLIFVTPWIAAGADASGGMLWSNLVSGAVIAVLAATTIGVTDSNPQGAAGSGGLNALLGAWVFISAFVFAVGTTYLVLNLVFGGVVAAIGAYNAFAGGAQGRPTYR